MPSAVEAFYSFKGTQAFSISTAPVPVQLETADGIQGAIVSNLSTNTMQVLIAQSSLTTMSTLSTASIAAGTGFILGPSKQFSVTLPPNAWISGMTTATSLTGILAVSPGIGII